MQTAALVFQGKNEIQLTQIEMGEPGPDEVQVRTTASMISTGTERWILTDQFSASGTPFPCVPGYQRVGIITKLGSNVQGFQPGERVIATSGQWSGPVVSYWGAHLATANTRKEEIYKLPERIGDADAAGVVVAQVGFNAASRIQLAGGDWIVVYGDGMIGHCASQAAKARGAKTIMVGHRNERLALAKLHSADHVINSHEGDVAEWVKRITGGQWVTAVLDTVQNEKVQREYVPLLKTGEGQIVYCGHSSRTSWADMPLLQLHALTCYYVSDWTPPRLKSTIRLMAEGGLSLEGLVTHRGKAGDAPIFYKMLQENKEPFLGILIDWGDYQ
jgi:2-desacetyl-2-hydroxyethyl bacteriochlorophyllide A dehydrogenase